MSNEPKSFFNGRKIETFCARLVTSDTRSTDAISTVQGYRLQLTEKLVQNWRVATPSISADTLAQGFLTTNCQPNAVTVQPLSRVANQLFYGDQTA